MGEPSATDTSSGNPQAVYDIYRAHASGLRIHTDSIIQTALLAEYPSHSLTSTTCNLIAYAKAGHATATLNDEVHPALRSWAFKPAARRSLGSSSAGTLKEEILFGRYDYVWQGDMFQVFVVEGQSDPLGQCGDRRCYVLSQSVNKGAAEALVIAVSIWSEQIHNEVWVYDQGWWSKDKELWRVAQEASWDNVILGDEMKGAIMQDVAGFFDAKDAYAEFGTPWKVGCHCSWANALS